MIDREMKTTINHWILQGKDYKKHSALVNVLKDKNYEIEKAYIFSEGNVETKGQKIYMPIFIHSIKFIG